MSDREAYIGEIIMQGFTQAPKGWAICDGSLLTSTQYEALYGLIGNSYGGGEQQFAVPDLRSRVPVGAENPNAVGETGGQEAADLTLDHLPAHDHRFEVSQEPGNSNSPIGRYPAKEKFYAEVAGPAGAKGYMHPNTVGPNRGYSRPFDTLSSCLAVQFSICLIGTFPPRH